MSLHAPKITVSRLASNSVELKWEAEIADELIYQLSQRLIATTEPNSNSSIDQPNATSSDQQHKSQQSPAPSLSLFDTREYQMIYEGTSTGRKVEGLRADTIYAFRLRVRLKQLLLSDGAGLQGGGWNGAVESNIEIKTEDALTMEHRLRDLIAAVAGQDSDSVVEMLNQYHIANMDTQDRQGHTLLMVASRVSLAVEGMRALCENGASVSATTQSGKTALMMAARVGNVSGIRSLVKYGANLNDKDLAGTTALMLACDYGQTEAAKVLLELGAHAQDTDLSGSNCLLRVSALPNASKDIMNFLVRQAKIDVNSRNPKGCTPLMFAAMQGRAETIECLMALGADKTLVNQNGNTAYALAESLNNSRVIRWFDDHK